MTVKRGRVYRRVEFVGVAWSEWEQVGRVVLPKSVDRRGATILGHWRLMVHSSRRPRIDYGRSPTPDGCPSRYSTRSNTGWPRR